MWLQDKDCGSAARLNAVQQSQAFRSHIIRVSGTIRLPSGKIFYPEWKACVNTIARDCTGPTADVGSGCVYGGYVDGREALTCETSKLGVVTYIAGDALPGGCHVVPLEASATNVRVQISSSILPPNIYLLDRGTGSLVYESSPPSEHFADLIPSTLTHQQLHAISTDGTIIPIDCFGTALAGSLAANPQPTIVHVYGGFGESNHTIYSPQVYEHWLKHGYNIAFVHTRGGNEYGKCWHLSAIRNGRSRVRQDLVAAVRLLHAARICKPNTTVLHGMSHGALVASITAIRHCGLAEQIVCRVPISTTKDIALTELGRQWIPEYGDPRTTDWAAFMESEDPMECHATPDCLAGTNWLIIGYCSDAVTRISHAKALKDRVNQLGGKVTCWFYTDSGGHEGATVPTIRIAHAERLWNYLRVQAVSTQASSSQAADAQAAKTPLNITAQAMFHNEMTHLSC